MLVRLYVVNVSFFWCVCVVYVCMLVCMFVCCVNMLVRCMCIMFGPLVSVLVCLPVGFYVCCVYVCE